MRHSLAMSIVSVLSIASIALVSAAADLPLLELPYGTWRAARYDEAADIYTFKNVRYAAPPIYDLRWAAPAPPEPVAEIQNGSYGPSCWAVWPTGADPEGLTYGEDCLFLDVYVPGQALRNTSLGLPVIVYIYGGGYASGSKEEYPDVGLFNGTGIVKQSNNSAIVVVPNYRLGTFGFLSSPTIEQHGLANAGLHDQRAALAWVQSYISLLGGSPASVSAWGTSAGAGSILLHLVQDGGKTDPLFHRAVVQSAAPGNVIDRKGRQKDAYKVFMMAVGCETGGGDGEGEEASLECLRRVSEEALVQGNEVVLLGPGGWEFIPSPDGEWLRETGTLELAKGNFWPNLESIIVSHTSDEASILINDNITTDAEIDALIRSQYPVYANASVSAILARYPPSTSSGSPFPTVQERLKAYTNDTYFLSATRLLENVYAGKVYGLKFSAAGGTHGSDVIPTWYDPALQGKEDTYGQREALFEAYQSYLISHAVTGDPNALRKRGGDVETVEWGILEGVPEGDMVGAVLEVSDDGFKIVDDEWVSMERVKFWLGVYDEITKDGGYAPDE